MSQKVRETRVLNTSTRTSSKRKVLSAPQKTVFALARSALRNKDYEQAQTILDNDTPYKHWHKCLHAKLLYQKNQIQKAFQAVRTSIDFHRQNCCECLMLMLTLLQKYKDKLKKYGPLLRRICELQSVPNNLRREFRSLLKQSQLKHNTFDQPPHSSCSQLLLQYGQRGVKFPKVEVAQIRDEYRVTIAKKVIYPQQVIIFVPENQIITLEKAKENEIVKKISAHELSFRSPKHCILSVFLLLEKHKKESSHYFRYIKSLPVKLDNFPIYYSKELEDELEGTSFANILRRKRLDLNEDYKELSKIIERPDLFTIEEFEWARMIVSSRIFGIIAGGIKTDALVPIADMLNHRLPKMTTWYFSDKKKGFVVENLDSSIKANEQIYDSYGLKCNSRFLLNYGFIQENNLANEITISLKKIDQSHSVCQNIRISANLTSQEFKTLILHYRKEIYLKNRQEPDDSDDQDFSNIISRSVQLSVWKQIGHLFATKMQKFKTTIMTDEKIIVNRNLDRNYRNCVEIRLGQKKVIDFYLKMARTLQQYFSKSKRNLSINLTPYTTYLNSIGEEEIPNMKN